MIIELVDILIQPGQQEEFDKAIAYGINTFIAKTPGFLGYRIGKSIESPERYVLQNYWATLENHTVDFRGSQEFLQWRGVVGSFFVRPPLVEHLTILDEKSVAVPEPIPPVAENA